MLLVKIKKRDGRFEEFNESKIVAGIKKAGATVEEAGAVAKKVAENSARNADEALKIGEFTTTELSRMVAAELAEINKAASDEFIKFRDNKLKTNETTS